MLQPPDFRLDRIVQKTLSRIRLGDNQTNTRPGGTRNHRLRIRGTPTSRPASSDQHLLEGLYEFSDRFGFAVSHTGDTLVVRCFRGSFAFRYVLGDFVDEVFTLALPFIERTNRETIPESP